MVQWKLSSGWRKGLLAQICVYNTSQTDSKLGGFFSARFLPHESVIWLSMLEIWKYPSCLSLYFSQLHVLAFSVAKDLLRSYRTTEGKEQSSISFSWDIPSLNCTALGCNSRPPWHDHPCNYKGQKEINNSPQADATRSPSLANRSFSLIFFSTGSMLGAIFYMVPDLKLRDEGSWDEREALISHVDSASQ